LGHAHQALMNLLDHLRPQLPGHAAQGGRIRDLLPADAGELAVPLVAVTSKSPVVYNKAGNCPGKDSYAD